MEQLKRWQARLRGIRGLEGLALLVAAALIGLLVLNAGVRPAEEARTGLEQRLEAVLSRIDGAGAVRVLVTEEAGRQSLAGEDGEAGRIIGVLIVAEGADDLGVSLALQQAVQALLQIDLNQIEIARMRRD